MPASLLRTMSKKLSVAGFHQQTRLASVSDDSSFHAWADSSFFRKLLVPSLSTGSDCAPPHPAISRNQPFLGPKENNICTCADDRHSYTEADTEGVRGSVEPGSAVKKLNIGDIPMMMIERGWNFEDYTENLTMGTRAVLAYDIDTFLNCFDMRSVQRRLTAATALLISILHICSRTATTVMPVCCAAELY